MINIAINLKPWWSTEDFPYEKDFYSKPFSKSKVPDFDLWNEKIRNVNPTITKEELNNYNYRCDNFTKNHNGKHILFSGCSYTWGAGIKYEDTWAHQVYKKISKDEKVSGYFNIGTSGSSLIHQIATMFQYFEEFGNPDIIFINTPDFCRMYGYSSKKNIIIDALYEHDASKIIELLSYQYYFMLNAYCKTNNIKLFCFSWVYAEKNLDYLFKSSKFENLDTFYKYDIDEMKEFVKNYKKENPFDQFADIARDEGHLGNAYHEFWSDFIYNRYKNNNE